MPKRKPTEEEQPSKKRKSDPAADITKTTITKQLTISPIRVTWPDSDIKELVKKIEETIPENDSISYTARLEKINWENMAFKSYSSIDCKAMWATLQKPVRKFRLLSEIMDDIKAQLETPKTPTPPKHHPDMPKQPRNSFMFFLDNNRAEVAHQNPDMRPTELARELGQMFKNLPEEERSKYEEMAQIAREEYKLKMQTFYDDHPEVTPPKKTRNRRPEDREGPERPKKPFDLFVQVETEKEPEMQRLALVQKCREEWNQFTDKEKFFWINWADELHCKYLEDLKEYMKKHPDFKPKPVAVLSRKEKHIKEVCCGKPQKPPFGAYHLFSRMMLESEEVRNINHKDLMTYVSSRWKACSEAEKNEYKVRIEQMWEDYERQLEDYLRTLPPEERDQVRKEESKKTKKSDKKTPVKEKPVEKFPQPAAPPANSEKYFCREYKGEGNPSEVWKTLSKTDKEEYEKKLDKARQEYLSNYEKYLKSLDRDELVKLGSLINQESSSESESESESSDSDEEE